MSKKEEKKDVEMNDKEEEKKEEPKVEEVFDPFLGKFDKKQIVSTLAHPFSVFSPMSFKIDSSFV